MKKVMGILLVLVLSVGCSNNNNNNNNNNKDYAQAMPIGISEDQDKIIKTMGIENYQKIKIENFDKLNAKDIEVGYVYQKEKNKGLVFKKIRNLGYETIEDVNNVELTSVFDIYDNNIKTDNVFVGTGKMEDGTFSSSAKFESKIIDNLININDGYTITPKVEYKKNNDIPKTKVEKGKKYLINGIASTNKGSAKDLTNDIEIINQKNLSNWNNFYGIYFIVK